MDKQQFVVDIDELQDIMDELPEAPDGGEKRKNALTKDDVLIIARVVKAVSHQKCERFSDDEVQTVRRFTIIINKTANAIGMAVLVAVGAGVVGIVTRGFWVTLAEKITKQH